MVDMVDEVMAGRLPCRNVAAAALDLLGGGEA